MTEPATDTTQERLGDGQVRVRRALISVSDKTGVADFAKGLAALGVEILFAPLLQVDKVRPITRTTRPSATAGWSCPEVVVAHALGRRVSLIPS